MNRSNDNHAEREMTSYLLGEMTDDEQTQFEMRYLADDTLFDQMLLVKQELIDAYVRDHLDAEAREKFERHFLATPEAQKEVAFARALREKLNEPAREAPAKAQRSRWLGWFDSWAAREIGLAAAASLLLVTGLGWLLVENQKLRHELVALRAEQSAQSQREQGLAEQLAEVRGQGSPAPNPAPRETPQPAPPRSETLVAINLTSDQRAADDLATAKLPSGTARLRLRLLLNFEPQPRACRVMVRGTAGRQIALRTIRAVYKNDGYVIETDLLAALFQNGEYTATVIATKANQQPVETAYRFRVAR